MKQHEVIIRASHSAAFPSLTQVGTMLMFVEIMLS